MASGVSEGEQPTPPQQVQVGEVVELTTFDDLYRREYEPMVRLARGLVDTMELAEEVVQDAFAKVLDRWGRLDRPGAYLRTAVVNGARSELRKREVRRRIGLRPFM
ncbi:MAG: SigE family RNA polymerase sigma factor, partial [bacterium]|nr:SigE family RNA polymerase sigma factor [bacterium]